MLFGARKAIKRECSKPHEQHQVRVEREPDRYHPPISHRLFDREAEFATHAVGVRTGRRPCHLVSARNERFPGH